jgi:hypothetical protein
LRLRVRNGRLAANLLVREMKIEYAMTTSGFVMADATSGLVGPFLHGTVREHGDWIITYGVSEARASADGGEGMLWCTLQGVADAWRFADANMDPRNSVLVQFYLPYGVVQSCLSQSPSSLLLHPMPGTTYCQFRPASFTVLNNTMTNKALVEARFDEPG